MKSLRAPFPWFGGKSKVAHVVWNAFGDTRNYVEPFFGSGAVLLARPTEAKIETINDLDCWVANFWRAVQFDPEAVAAAADWPVNEADLHARHLWLVKQVEFRERMKTDPDYFDAKIAGWWVWGISQWIGSGWCQQKELRADGNPRDKSPMLSSGGQGVNRGRGAAGKGKARGVATATHQKRPRLAGDHGRGVLNRKVTNQIPDLSGDGGAAGRGIHASAFQRGKMPSIGGRDWGINSENGMERREGGLYEWMYALSDRLRRVRVCCGDWRRILGPAPTTCIGLTGVFLDPPYAVEDRSDGYGEESRDVAHDVREWAIANGENPELRIALCGYDTEHAMPANWREVAWKANGGFANQKADRTSGKENAHRERIWFSPHCLIGQEVLDFGRSE